MASRTRWFRAVGCRVAVEYMKARLHAWLTTADGIYEWMAEGPRTS